MAGGAPTKYNKTIAGRICKLLATDSYSIREICRLTGISPTSYYKWQAEIAEFADAIKKARDTFDETLCAVARKSLLSRVKGFTGGDGKYYPPDTTAIIFTLTNRDPEHWRNRQSADITSNGNTIAAAEPLPQVVITRDALGIIQSGTLPPLPDSVRVVESDTEGFLTKHE